MNLPIPDVLTVVRADWRSRHQVFHFPQGLIMIILGINHRLLFALGNGAFFRYYRNLSGQDTCFCLGLSLVGEIPCLSDRRYPFLYWLLFTALTGNQRSRSHLLGSALPWIS